MQHALLAGRVAGRRDRLRNHGCAHTLEPYLELPSEVPDQLRLEFLDIRDDAFEQELLDTDDIRRLAT